MSDGPKEKREGAAGRDATHGCPSKTVESPWQSASSHSHGAIFHILRIFAPTQAIPSRDRWYNRGEPRGSPRLESSQLELHRRSLWQFRGSNKLFMAAPCAPLVSSPLSPPRWLSSTLDGQCRCCCCCSTTRATSPRCTGVHGTPAPALSSPSKRVGYGKRERERETRRGGRGGTGQDGGSHGGALKGVTFGANSVPSGCLHQFYRRFLNPAVGTDFTRPHLVASHKSVSRALRKQERRHAEER